MFDCMLMIATCHTSDLSDDRYLWQLVIDQAITAVDLLYSAVIGPGGRQVWVRNRVLHITQFDSRSSRGRIDQWQGWMPIEDLRPRQQIAKDERWTRGRIVSIG